MNRTAIELPKPTGQESIRLELLYRYCRLQAPDLVLPHPEFLAELNRTLGLYLPKAESPIGWATYLDGLYPLDWVVCIGCLRGSEPAWERLFAARTGRSDCLLVDALRARSYRLYPRDEERRESAVTEFWSQLLVPVNERSSPILARYDGQRPLAPWLIRVFQNFHLSRLRENSAAIALPDDDIAMPLPAPPKEEVRWHEAFCTAAQCWLDGISDQERLILGLRWRYQLSQREVAKLFGVHEGTISRQTDKLRDKALEEIGSQLIASGWVGEDLQGFVLREMGSVLVDDPKLSADHLARLLAAKGIELDKPDDTNTKSP